MELKVILKDVNKFYGKKHILNNINLEIEKGMFGLLGKNGAGKTTLMKSITTLTPINSGEIKVCGIGINKSHKIREIIGYLPQDFSMYNNMSSYEVMDYLGVLSGLNKKTRKERIPILLDKVNLNNHTKTKVKAMSGGMKRRLGIAQALLHDPKVLIVDEPTAGLDPEERVRFRNLLSEIAYDKVVILSTHISGDVEATCENIAILDNGEIIFKGKVKELLDNAYGMVYEARVSKAELDNIKKKYIVTNVFTMPTEANVRFIEKNKENLFNGAKEVSPNVEDAYMYLIKTYGGKK